VLSSTAQSEHSVPGGLADAANALEAVTDHCLRDGHDPASCPIRAVLAQGVALEATWVITVPRNLAA
jgi:hypothetical protein